MKEQNHLLLNRPLSPSGPLALDRRTFIAGLGAAGLVHANGTLCRLGRPLQRT
jgi:hypothetical protein